MSCLDALLLYICLPNMLVCWCKVRCREYQLFWRAAAVAWSSCCLYPVTRRPVHTPGPDTALQRYMSHLHVTQTDNMSRLYIADISVSYRHSNIASSFSLYFALPIPSSAQTLDVMFSRCSENETLQM